MNVYPQLPRREYYSDPVTFQQDFSEGVWRSFVASNTEINNKIGRFNKVNLQFDRSGGGQAVSVEYAQPDTVTIPTAKQAQVFSVRPTVTLEGSGIFRGYDFDITATGTSSSNFYGVIGALRAKGDGSAKAIYGRASMQTGFLGVGVGLVGAVDAVSTAGTGWIAELAYTGASPTQSAGIIIQGDDPLQSGAGHAWQTAIQIDGSSQWSNSVLQWNQNASGSGGGDFQRLYNPSSSLIYKVDGNGGILNTTTIQSPHLIADRNQAASENAAGLSVTMHGHASGSSLRAAELVLAGTVGSTASQALFIGGDSSGNAFHHGILGDSSLKLDTAFIQRKMAASESADFAILYDNSSNILWKVDSTGKTTLQDLAHQGTNLGFYGTTPTTKPTVTGSRGGNAALASLLTALASLGLIVDSSS